MQLHLIVLAIVFYASYAFQPAGATNPLSAYAQEVYDDCRLQQYQLDFKVFEKAMIGHYNIMAENKEGHKPALLTIFDLTKPSTERRFYVINLEERQVKFYTFASHGENSGKMQANEFSNVMDSHQSSLGFYLTAETYVGKHGYSLRLDGLEEGFNAKARERNIVIHPAPYASTTYIKKHGMLGNSEGCPAIPPNISKELIDLIKEGCSFFIYADEPTYLEESLLLNQNKALEWFTSR